MKDKNGGRLVTEKQLFHGTDNKYLDDICKDNIDWRLCGTHGTAYGKGELESWGTVQPKTLFTLIPFFFKLFISIAWGWFDPV